MIGFDLIDAGRLYTRYFNERWEKQILMSALERVLANLRLCAAAVE